MSAPFSVIAVAAPAFVALTVRPPPFVASEAPLSEMDPAEDAIARAPPCVVTDAPEFSVMSPPALSVMAPAASASAPLTAIAPPTPPAWIVNGALALQAPTLTAPVPLADPMVTEAKPGAMAASAVLSRLSPPA